jgi:hypothetical protein
MARIGRVKAFNGSHETYDLAKLVPGEIRVSPIVSQSTFVHRFSDEDVAKVREQSFDVLIRCGSGILRGAILSSARLGIISLQHGDDRINRGGIAGFWEVYYRQDRTGFVVQRLTEEPDGGEVILRGYIPTQDTHLLNAAMLFIKSYFHLRTLLLRIASTGQLPPAEAHCPYSGKLLVSPGARELVVYLSKQVARSVSERIRRALRYRERWGICFAKRDWRYVVMGQGTRVETPPGRFLADPFVVTRGGRTCVFAEEFVFESAKGHIAAFELSEGGARPLGIALEESFHLSFSCLSIRRPRATVDCCRTVKSSFASRRICNSALTAPPSASFGSPASLRMTMWRNSSAA